MDSVFSVYVPKDNNLNCNHTIVQSIFVMKSVMYSIAVLTTNIPYCSVTFVNTFFTDE